MGCHHTYNVTSIECIAGNGYILERNDTSEYMKDWYKGSVSLRYLNWIKWNGKIELNKPVNPEPCY